MRGAGPAHGAEKTILDAAMEKLRRADERLNKFEKETGRRRRREREYGPEQARWPENAPKFPVGDQKPPENDQKVTESAQRSPGNAQDVSEAKSTSTEERMPAEKPLTDEVKNGTLSEETKDDGDGVREVATIRNESIFTRWGKVNPKVVLTDERIVHIKEGHAKDFEELGDHIGPAIESPTIILEDNKNASTALFIKRIEDSNLNIVVRLKIEGVDADDLQSSVITMYRLGEKTLIRLLKRNIILYNSDRA